MRIRSRLSAGLATILATISLAANAARIDYTASSKDGIADIHIIGDIERGDAVRFDKVVNSMPEKKAIVFLTSLGGRLVDGLIIGETIRSHGFITAVFGKCASTCGLIWLSGTSRYVNDSSYVGFHAAYTGTGSDAHESGRGNALVGAYLTKLGLSYAAVDYVTTSPPDGMTWLTFADAKRIGIEYRSIGPELASAPFVKPVVTAPAVRAPVAAASAAVSPDSTQSPAQAAAALTPAYAEGRQARIEYERWFAALPAIGDYRDGATFWASNRSLKPPPTCTCTLSADPAWRTGCSDSRARLAPVDRRRTTEPNYRSGWNSL